MSNYKVKFSNNKCHWYSDDRELKVGDLVFCVGVMEGVLGKVIGTDGWYITAFSLIDKIVGHIELEDYDDMYKNMPLIEPLEYKDVKAIKEFVIAIDTSGSVNGEQVQSFINKTYNIMKSTESFFSKINVHIIQCDTEIQEDAKITNQEEFDTYIQTMQLKGFGGRISDRCLITSIK